MSKNLEIVDLDKDDISSKCAVINKEKRTISIIRKFYDDWNGIDSVEVSSDEINKLKVDGVMI